MKRRKILKFRDTNDVHVLGRNLDDSRPSRKADALNCEPFFSPVYLFRYNIVLFFIHNPVFGMQITSMHRLWIFDLLQFYFSFLYFFSISLISEWKFVCADVPKTSELLSCKKLIEEAGHKQLKQASNLKNIKIRCSAEGVYVIISSLEIKFRVLWMEYKYI